MKRKTNISIKDAVGLKRTANIEVSRSGSYQSGDILDANSTSKLIDDKIDIVIGGASQALDTLKEIGDAIPTKVSQLQNDSLFVTQQELSTAIPTEVSLLKNDSSFVTYQDLQLELEGKADSVDMDGYGLLRENRFMYQEKDGLTFEGGNFDRFAKINPLDIQLIYDSDRPERNYTYSLKNIGDSIYNSDIVVVENSKDATAAVTTLTCQLGKYHRIPVAVNTLAITLPSMINKEHTQKITIMLSTDTTPAITFTASDNTPIYIQDGFSFEASSVYEVSIVYNGNDWVIAAIEMNAVLPAVDLGLPSGTLWATCNVGAKNPQDFGLYFSWGNVEGHKEGSGYDFSSETYDTSPAIKIESDIALSQDAANAYLGGSWHMPKQSLFQELYNNTMSEWVKDYEKTGVAGIKFMKKSDPSIFIFFPATGYYDSTTLINDGENGYYWSASSSSNVEVFHLYFNSELFVNPQSCNWRWYGFTVRAVR